MKQIPLVFENTVTSLDGAPLGSLPDALECKVTEERHGEFFCEMRYPAYGLNADLIQTGRIIAVQPNMYDNIQGFRIATIEKNLVGEMTVTAYHVSYDLAQVIVMPFTAANISDALDGLETYAVPSNAFSFETDKSTVATFAVTAPTPLRSLLVGTQGSLVDVYGGELKFDNWTVSLLASRGQDRNVQIAYAKNLTGFKEVDENGKYDAVVPFANFNDAVYLLTDTGVCATAPIVYADGNGGTYGYPKAMPLDLSDKFESETEPTQALLYQYALQYIARNSGSPTVNMSTEYVDLAKVMGSTERVDLCDTVYISVRPYNVWNLTSKVIKIVYDALLDENAEVEIGDRRITLADTLAGVVGDEKNTGAIAPSNQIPYIVGTQAAATNKWTGNAPFASLNVGQGIRYYLPYAGNSSAATLNLTLADGSQTGEIGIRRLASTTVTTTYAAGCVILMTYDGEYWKCDAYVAGSNTIGYQLRTNSSSLPAQAKFYRYRLLFTSADGTKWVPANTSSSTNATASRAVNQTPIDPFGEIVYYGTTTAIEADALVTAAQIWQQYTLTLGYSFNRTGAALVLPYPKPIYIKAAPQADGSCIIDDTTPYVTALPASQDHKIYIMLGRTYSATAIELTMKHPVYYHDGTGIRLYTGGVI